jgi:hypothetical protein
MLIFGQQHFQVDTIVEITNFGGKFYYFAHQLLAEINARKDGLVPSGAQWHDDYSVGGVIFGKSSAYVSRKLGHTIRKSHFLCIWSSKKVSKAKKNSSEM